MVELRTARTSSLGVVPGGIDNVKEDGVDAESPVAHE